MNGARKGWNNMKRVMIVGTGLEARRVAERLTYMAQMQLVAWMVPGTATVQMDDVVILNNWQDIPCCLKKLQIHIVCFVSSNGDMKQKQQLMAWCKESGCEFRQEPSNYKIEGKTAEILHMAQEHMEELLGRPAAQFPVEQMKKIEGKTVLVTGAGGTIGSEICRVIAQWNPRKLILLDISENDSIRTMCEVELAGPKAVMIIGSVANKRLIDSLFMQYHPQIVFHAAAHKHVPIMENNVSECMENNVFGTYYCAMAARKYGTETFVLISTDKAAQPVSAMGKAKRIGEMLMQELQPISDTDFLAVRFGNVIGSSGSVLPIFARQIAYGGPLTLTDRGMSRFFMTVQEAANLVISAAFLVKKAHIYMLDMGKPVQITELAKRLLKVVNQTDIPIVYMGKRDGEKLTETLCAPGERLCSSEQPHIFALEDQRKVRGKPWFEDLVQLQQSLFQEEEKVNHLIECLLQEREPINFY